MKKTTKYLITAFILITTACEKDSSVENCLCTISLSGNIWSQYNVTDCNTCNAPQGYTANCNCE